MSQLYNGHTCTSLTEEEKENETEKEKEKETKEEKEEGEYTIWSNGSCGALRNERFIQV